MVTALKPFIIARPAVISSCKCFGQQVACEREEEEAEVWGEPGCVRLKPTLQLAAAFLCLYLRSQSLRGVVRSFN